MEQNNNNLTEQENMKKFLQLLEENGMHDEKQSVQLLAGYVDQMESHFTTVLEELKNVRQELSTIQDKTMRATAGRAVDKVVVKVEEAKGQLLKFKNHIMNTVDKAVNDFKEYGKTALAGAMKSLHVKGILEHIKEGLHHATKSADHGIDNLTRLGNEIHAVNTHFKNAGRVMIGKNVKEVLPRDSDKGMLSKVQEGLFFSMKAFTKMAKKTDNALSTIKRMENKANDRKSVRNDLKDIKKHQQAAAKHDKTGKEIELEQR